MPKQWKDILTDAATYPDDFTISLKDGSTMTLGDMRSYDKEHEGELTRTLTAREQDVVKRERDLSTATNNLGVLIEKTAERAGLTIEEFMAGRAPTKRQVAAAADLDENDPLVGSLVKEMKGMQAKFDAQETAIASLRKDALGPMLNTYLEDFYESRWEKLSPSLPKDSKVTRDQALKYAMENSYKDSHGRLDLSKAIKDLTYDDRVQADAHKIAADLRKKDDDARALAVAPRPASLGQKIKTDKSLLNEKGRTKNFDEVLNDATNDVDLWRSIQQIQ
jgi:hypothetical protein